MVGERDECGEEKQGKTRKQMSEATHQHLSLASGFIWFCITPEPPVGTFAANKTRSSLNYANSCPTVE